VADAANAISIGETDITDLEKLKAAYAAARDARKDTTA
jgi:hypothetical protein